MPKIKSTTIVYRAMRDSHGQWIIKSVYSASDIYPINLIFGQHMPKKLIVDAISYIANEAYAHGYRNGMRAGRKG